VPYAVPGLDRLRLLRPLGEGRSVFAPPPRDDALPKVGEAELPEGASVAQAQPQRLAPRSAVSDAVGARDSERAPLSIDDPNNALGPLFRVLARAERGEPGAVARISYWGDSNAASDLITAWLRRKLQARFGDAGHGFVLPANSDEYYMHNDIRRGASAGWVVSRIVGPLAADGLYGLGGASFRSRWENDFSWVETSRAGGVGQRASRFAVDYLAHPDGPPIDLLVDGQRRETIDSAAPRPRAAVRTIEVADGPHRFELRPRAPGARVFGMWLERAGPGVVVDALGLAGAKVRYLARIDEAHFAEQLVARAPQLWILNYGVNAGQEGGQFPIERYESTMRDVVLRMKRALPQAGCLVVAPNDLAWKSPEGVYLSKRIAADLAAAQKRVASSSGCAFWNMYQAMGGTGAMGRWIDQGLARPDMLHPTPAGAELLGRWLYLALMERYAESTVKTGSR
jgi:lysophospholipase L1-like esterase